MKISHEWLLVEFEAARPLTYGSTAGQGKAVGQFLRLYISVAILNLTCQCDFSCEIVSVSCTCQFPFPFQLNHSHFILCTHFSLKSSV